MKRAILATFLILFFASPVFSQSIIGGGVIGGGGSGTAIASHDAYSSSWNGSILAPDQNAIYDWGHSFDTNDDGSLADEAAFTAAFQAKSTAATADLNIIDGISDTGSLTAAEILKLDGIAGNIMSYTTATAVSVADYEGLIPAGTGQVELISVTGTSNPTNLTLDEGNASTGDIYIIVNAGTNDLYFYNDSDVQFIPMGVVHASQYDSLVFIYNVDRWVYIGGRQQAEALASIEGGVNIGADGVNILDDSDGAITFLGLGDGNDEDLTFNFDDTADTVVITSSTGVATLSFTDMQVQATSFLSDRSANPCITFRDSNATDDDNNGTICLDLTDTSSGAEDGDITISVQVAGALTDRINIDADGDTTVTGNLISTGAVLGVQYKQVWIPAQLISPNTTSGSAALAYSETETNTVETSYLAFDGGSEEYATFMLPFDPEWDLGTVKAKFAWSSADSSSADDTVEWEIGCAAISNDDSLDTDLYAASQVISDTLLEDNGLDMQWSGATPAITVQGTPALGDMIFCKISRNVGGTDDMSEDAWLYGVYIQYKTNSTEISGW